MYAGVSSKVSNSCASLDNENLSVCEIPAWKKKLIMKKRAGNCAEELPRRLTDSAVTPIRNGRCSGEVPAAGVPSGKFGTRSAKVVEQDFREISPPKTVTIGNINVELRSVKSSEKQITPDVAKTNQNYSEVTHPGTHGGDSPDLQYGPGIVDRLRARFLNMGAKQECKPVVRRFSSLENLPNSNAGLYRVNARGARQNGFKSGLGSYYGTGHVKKAQSMETLLCSGPEQPSFSTRLSSRYCGGVKGMLKNLSPISVVTDENDEPRSKSPSPAVSPRLFTKSVRRWDYSRSVSAPNINEDELPKPDTVKYVKQLFESPPSASVNGSEKPLGQRFRKISDTSQTPPASNGAITGNAPVKICPDAKVSAKRELPDLLHVNRSVSYLSNKKEEVPLSPVETCVDNKINKAIPPSVLGDCLSANRPCDTLFEQELSSPCGTEDSKTSTPDSVPSCTSEVGSPEGYPKVAPDLLPFEEDHKHSEVLSQGGQVSQVEHHEDALPTGVSSSPVQEEGGMVVAASSSAGDSSGAPQKGPSWQKPPQSTTSIVFDFRGKDVKPNISLNPAPFGCRPAKVTKRSGSPPRSGVTGVDSVTSQMFPDNSREDEEDWDEMDIGADLPAVSGIVFTGENVKVGRGALLEKRNKKLSIQFDDKATATFEYVSENSSPTPVEDTWTDDGFNSTAAMASASNHRLVLSNYTPQILCSNDEFQLGVSQQSHKNSSVPEKLEDTEVSSFIPTNMACSAGWSATETADILF